MTFVRNENIDIRQLQTEDKPPIPAAVRKGLKLKPRQRLIYEVREEGVTSAVAPVGDGDEGGEFGGGRFHGDVFSLKLSRTPPIMGHGRAAFYRTLVLCRTPTGGSESERKGLQKNAGTMSTKRIFTMVMPGNIMA